MSSSDSTRRVLVTGASGFTGRYLVPLLRAQGWIVNAPGGELDLTDIRSIGRVLEEAQPDAVVHLGAIAFAAHGDSDRYYQTNTLGTLNLLSSIASLGIELEHFVFASTAAVYGNQGLPLLDEGLTPAPASDYGVSKLAAEHIVNLHSTASSTIIFRPFNYTGVGQNEQFIIPKLVAHYAGRKPSIELGNIDVAREFNDVRWAASLYLAALGCTEQQLTLNLCTGRTHSLHEVMQKLEELTSHQPDVQINQQFVRANDLPSLAGDAQRLQAALGMPAARTLDETLSWMCENYTSSS